MNTVTARSPLPMATFPTPAPRKGEQRTAHLGYPDRFVGALPPSLVDDFAAAGNPHPLAALRAGETVVVAGGGVGVDAVAAAMAVGPRGQVLALEPRRPAHGRAVAASRRLGLRHLGFREAPVTAIPLASSTADAAIVNGLDLDTVELAAAAVELRRILHGEGRLVWTSSVRDLSGGAAALAGALRAAGFSRIAEAAGGAQGPALVARP